MKKIILFLLLFFASGVYAQSPYVDGATVTADGITFEVYLAGYTLGLSNIANVRGEWPLYYKDGRKLKTEAEYMTANASLVDRNAIFRAVKEVLSEDVIKMFRKERYSPMRICYTVGPNGETLEVAFIMRAIPSILSLPPETFAALEKKLKQYVKWEPNEFAKGLTYFHMSGSVNFDKVPISGELYPYPEISPAPRLPLIRD